MIKYMYVNLEIYYRRTKDSKKLNRDMEREKATQQREIERLGRELQRVSGQLRNSHKPPPHNPHSTSTNSQRVSVPSSSV